MQQVYMGKEIFALVAKAGVISNSIPDMHQALIDDNPVEKQKIGGSNYFWSFPAKKERKAQIQNEEIVKNIAQLKSKAEEASAQLADAKRGRKDVGEGEESRASKLSELYDMERIRRPPRPNWRS